MTKHCIINFAKDGREKYSHGQRRLRASLADEKADLLFKQSYPEGCPPTEKISHAFKAYMFKLAFDKGYDSILWLDASAIVKRDLRYVWQCIENDGYFFVDNEGCPQVMWASERQLVAMGCSLAEAGKFTMCRSGIMGLHRKHEQVIDVMIELSKRRMVAYNGDKESRSPLFKEPRHDQAVFSFAIHKMKLYKHPSFLAQYSEQEDFGLSIVEFKGI